MYTYDLSIRPLNKTQPKEYLSSYGSTISDKFNSIFHYRQSNSNIVDHEIIIQDFVNGQIIDTIQRQTFPIKSLSILDENTLLYITGSFSNSKVYILSLDSLKNKVIPDSIFK